MRDDFIIDVRRIKSMRRMQTVFQLHLPKGVTCKALYLVIGVDMCVRMGYGS